MHYPHGQSIKQEFDFMQISTTLAPCAKTTSAGIAIFVSGK